MDEANAAAMLDDEDEENDEIPPANGLASVEQRALRGTASGRDAAGQPDAGLRPAADGETAESTDDEAEDDAVRLTFSPELSAGWCIWRGWRSRQHLAVPRHVSPLSCASELKYCGAAKDPGSEAVNVLSHLVLLRQHRVRSRTAGLLQGSRHARVLCTQGDGEAKGGATRDVGESLISSRLRATHLDGDDGTDVALDAGISKEAAALLRQRIDERLRQAADGTLTRLHGVHELVLLSFVRGAQPPAWAGGVPRSLCCCACQ